MSTRYEINHLTIIFADSLPHSAEEIQAYHDHAVRTHPTAKQVTVTFEPDPDDADGVGEAARLDYVMWEPFERIRRITGYLQTVNNFNNAKRAEEQDRVKHA